MDAYTSEVEGLLDRRYRFVDDQGVYFAHQPIYGFRRGHAEPASAERYIRTFGILKALASVPGFANLVDIGCAEGYTAGLIRELFRVRVCGTDLSASACAMAKRLFGVDARPADIHKLPFGDGEFDVVLCSETLEHVTDYRGALTELLRVAKTALIITVPHESLETVEAYRASGEKGGHIHAFDLHTLDFIKKSGFAISATPINSPLLRLPGVLIEAAPKRIHRNSRFPGWAVSIYNAALPLLHMMFGVRAMAMLIHVDRALCRLLPSYGGIVYVISKDPKVRPSKVSVSAQKMVRFSVPLLKIEDGIPYSPS